jgi:hypothetical protein
MTNGLMTNNLHFTLIALSLFYFNNSTLAALGIIPGIRANFINY